MYVQIDFTLMYVQFQIIYTASSELFTHLQEAAVPGTFLDEVDLPTHTIHLAKSALPTE